MNGSALGRPSSVSSWMAASTPHETHERSAAGPRDAIASAANCASRVNPEVTTLCETPQPWQPLNVANAMRGPMGLLALSPAFSPIRLTKESSRRVTLLYAGAMDKLLSTTTT